MLVRHMLSTVFSCLVIKRSIMCTKVIDLNNVYSILSGDKAAKDVLLFSSVVCLTGVTSVTLGVVRVTCICLQ